MSLPAPSSSSYQGRGKMQQDSNEVSGAVVEHCQTTILERNLSCHRALNEQMQHQAKTAATAKPSGAIGSNSNVPTPGFRSASHTAASGAAAMISEQENPCTEESPLLGQHNSDTASNENDDSPLPSRSNSVPTLLEYYNSGFVDSPRGNNGNGFGLRMDSMRVVAGGGGGVRGSNRTLIDDALDQSTNTIRFQVIWWHVGQVDMVQGRVPVTFRVTIFWNTNDGVLAADADCGDAINNAYSANDTQSQYGGSQKTTQSGAASKYRMVGRQQAVLLQPATTAAAATTAATASDAATVAPVSTTIDVPAVSILNVATFDTIGDPEVSVLRETMDENDDTTHRLLRWSCMYRATLNQEHWQVENFPHDTHEISLRLAILAHRQAGAVWDRTVWKLALATADDSQGSVRVPHGLVVDTVKIPEFQYNQSNGLAFELKALDHGPGSRSNTSSSINNSSTKATCDTCLEVKLKVVRNSSYYDRNIMPLLGMLNFVAVTITALDDTDFFQRALLTLNIAFVEIGMRMTADSKLPTASYQIKMQRILNEYFFGLLFLVLESLLVYEMQRFGFGQHTGIIDGCAALAVFSHNTWTLYSYYSDARRAQNAMFGSPSREKKSSFLGLPR